MNEYTGRIIPPIEGLHDSEAEPASLRDALEKLHDRLYATGVRGYKAVALELDAILNEHPAEPVGVSDEALLDRFIDNGKRLAREERGISRHTPTTAEVERFIPPDLRPKFWERYVGKYFDQVTP